MKTKLKSLTLQFIPFVEIDGLGSAERVKKLLKIILENKIVLLQGRLRAEEEARLIEDTMALVGAIKNFKGVELAVLSPKLNGLKFTSKLRNNVAKLLIGDRDAVTVIGPANIIKEIKRDPSKIQLFLK